MSGISASGAGDVKLDGDPNAFTGTNTFDVNRPTSTLADTPSTTDFITKQDGDALYQGAGNVATLNGNPNTFTGTNTFNTNRPTSTIATTPSSTDFITKQNADALYTNNTGDATLAGTNAFTGTNTFDVNRPSSTLAASPLTSDDDFITKGDGNAMYVGLTGTETIADVKTFTSVPVCATQPTNDNQLANKEYVDSAGGAPSNMMTTDTPQTISASKTFSNTLFATQPRIKGAVIQTIFNNYRESMTFTNKSGWTYSEMGLSITPKSGNSQILITCRIHYGSNSNSPMRWWGARLYKDFSEITGARNEDSSTSGCWFQQTAGFTNNSSYNYCYGAGDSYLDDAGSTGTRTYQLYIKPRVNDGGTGTFYINKPGVGSSSRPRMTSFIMAQEIYYP